MPCRVAPKKPFLTDAKKQERLKWCKSELRKPKSKWAGVWWVDEVNFATKASTGGRMVRIPKGADRMAEKYQRPTFSKPTKIMGLAGFNGMGKRFLFLLEVEQCEVHPADEESRREDQEERRVNTSRPGAYPHFEDDVALLLHSWGEVSTAACYLTRLQSHRERVWAVEKSDAEEAYEDGGGVEVGGEGSLEETEVQLPEEACHVCATEVETSDQV